MEACVYFSYFRYMCTFKGYVHIYIYLYILYFYIHYVDCVFYPTKLHIVCRFVCCFLSSRTEKKQSQLPCLARTNLANKADSGSSY